MVNKPIITFDFSKLFVADENNVGHYRAFDRGDVGTIFYADLPRNTAIVNVAFGALTLVGNGGDPMGYGGAEPLTIISGNIAQHWQIDFRNHLVPKNGANGYGTTGPAFVGPYVLGVTDGTRLFTVNVTILPNTAHIREMYNTAQNADNSATSFCQIQFAINNLDNTTPKTILCRDGWFNPTNNAFEIDSRKWVSPYPGAGRITIKSENIDIGLDTYGNPRRQHGFKLGAINFYGKNITAAKYLEYLDFDSVWFYTAATGGDVWHCVNNAGYNPYGINWTNCRIEGAPGSNVAGPATLGPASFTFNTFSNLGGGNGRALGCDTGVIAEDNIFDGYTVDCIDVSDITGLSVKRNLFKNGNISLGSHADALQIANILHTVTPGAGYTPGYYMGVPMSGGGTVGIIMEVFVRGDGTVQATNGGSGAGSTSITNKGTTYIEGVTLTPTNGNANIGGTGAGFALTTVVSPTGGVITDNILVADKTGANAGATQGTPFISNVDYPATLKNMDIHGNVNFSTAANGLDPSYTENPSIRFNTVLFDPFKGDTIQNCVISTGGNYGSGNVNISYNVSNGISDAAWPGVKTEVPVIANQTYAVVALTVNQIIAAYTVMYKNFPQTQVAYLAACQTYAGAVAIFIPNKTLQSAGGCKNPDGTYNGTYFPDGSKNDGSVYVGP